MSIDTNKNFFYEVVGRNIYLYQYSMSGTYQVLAGFRIQLPNDYYGNDLIYPDESIPNGLMFEGTAFIYPFVDKDPNELTGGANPTLVNQTSPDEDDHVNLTRMLTLAVIDYVKAMIADANGQLEKKEYYMREFWKKVGDHNSNKVKRGHISPASPYALR
mgnify:FL=1|tara:strand:- start:1115 stop:1594 length:480 start_codon:yes stop_codon:yes gene_type:complete